jgi:hypothetical protein
MPSLEAARIGRRWKTTSNTGTTSWHAQIKLGRVRLGYHVHRHEGHSSDRWVLQPWLTYDCAEKR